MLVARNILKLRGKWVPSLLFGFYKLTTLTAFTHTYVTREVINMVFVLGQPLPKQATSEN